ncbi:MAG: carboxypeptidase-like regulatory domain-containing protein [Bacteroidia bacterium]
MVCIGFGQNKTGSLKVTLIDAKSKDAIPFANITLYVGKIQKYVATTDVGGIAFFKQIALGKYNVKAVYVGYQSKTVKDVVVNTDKISYLTISLTNDAGVQLTEVTISEYSPPLIDPDTKSGATISRETYQHVADKSISGLYNMSPGVISNYNSSSSYKVRGSRGKKRNILLTENVQ